MTSPAPIPLSRPVDPLHDSLFLKACRRQPTERPPIWLMRQAGRYQPTYRALRAKVSFLELCKNSDLASHVTTEAVEQLGVDAAIIFSDILIPLEPLGFHLSYQPGPVISNPFRNERDIARMEAAEPVRDLGFVSEAIRKTRRALKSDLPLIGFIGAPFTLASYLIEGRSSKELPATLELMRTNPALWHRLMGSLTHHLIAFANQQIQAGAQAIQIFDSWVGKVAPQDYETSVHPYMKRLIAGINGQGPVIHFATQSAPLLRTFKESNASVIGLDWRVSIQTAWRELGDVAVMGNLDPSILLTTPERIRVEARRILNEVGGRPGHIFNLGHGVLPETPVENVRALVDYVKGAKPCA